MFAEKKNALDHLQKDMASILPSFPGQPAAKYFDLAIGVDFHATVMPPLPLCPVPHIGMVFDIMGAIMLAVTAVLPPPPAPVEVPEGEEPPPPPPVSVLSVATAVVSAMKPSVKVHGQWIANAGTGIQHLPAIIAHIAPVVSPMASSEMWMGSSTVLADGGPFSTQFHPALSCNLVGFPSLFRANKPPRPKMALLAPTSMLLVITSGGKPVLVGGPPTIDLFQLMFKMALKGLGKLWKKARGKAKAPDTKNPRLGKAQPEARSKCVGDPVDVVTGQVRSEALDVELPGPIPLRWRRNYLGNMGTRGPLGNNWHHSYNMGIHEMENGYFTLRLADGRETAMPALALGEAFYNRQEQLSWQRDQLGYLLIDAGKLLYRFEGPENAEGFRMLSSIEKAGGFAIRFTYDRLGRLLQIHDSSHRLINIQQDEEGHIRRLSLHNDTAETNLVSYDYDDEGNLAKVTDPRGYSKAFFYTEQLLTRMTLPEGLSFYWEYEGHGDSARCIHTWGDGEVLEYWLQYEEGKTLTRNRAGHTTTYYHRPDQLIYKIIDANGGISHILYNEYGEPATETNPEGHSVTYVYNDWGQLTKLLNENNEPTTYAYDKALNLVSITSPGGMQLSWEYDEWSRMISRKETDGSILRYQYENGLLTTLTDQKGRAYRMVYDRQYNLAQLILPNGAFQAWRHDHLGRITEATDVRGNTTRYRYDECSNIVWMREPDGNEHRFTYDAAGNMIHAVDNTHNVQFGYGALGVLTSRRQQGTAVSFAYDTELQLRSIFNEGGEAYRFGLDPMGRVVSEWGFDGHQRRFIRDGNGRVRKILRPGGRWTGYDYDGTGNVVREEYHDSSTAAYRYNKDGLLAEVYNEDAYIIFKRDRAGRITGEQQGEQLVSRKYDMDGNCSLIESSLGAHIEMQYDHNGFLEKMKAGKGADESWEASWQRDITGLELYREMTGSVNVRTERDKLGRVTRRVIAAQQGEQSRNRYEWAKGYKLTRLVGELTLATASFSYDPLDNLVSAAYEQKNGTETIYRVPDKIGNLFRSPARKDRIYQKGGRLQEDEKFYYHYDEEGNLVFREARSNTDHLSLDKREYAAGRRITLVRSGTGWAYEWAANGMLRKVIDPRGREIVFTYDPLGRRIAKVVNDQVTRWIWNGDTPLHEWQYRGEYPPQRAVSEQGIVPAAEPVENLVTWVFEEGSFVPAARIEKEKKYSIIADYLGTPTHAYDEDGKMVWERELDIYGNSRKETGQHQLVPYLYQGQYLDSETGLAYNRFRYYNRDTGSYISQDPIGLVGSNPTLYGYVKDPNLWVDELGLDCKPKGKKIQRTVYRYEQPNRLGTTWDTHVGNINARHRYTKPGVGGAYGANSKKTALAEVTHWGATDGRVLTSKQVKLNNVLDLTDPKVRDQLGVKLEDITGNSYDKTHELGDWAISNGYDGILAPSARNPTGSNLIGFNGL